MPFICSLCHLGSCLFSHSIVFAVGFQIVGFFSGVTETTPIGNIERLMSITQNWTYEKTFSLFMAFVVVAIMGLFYNISVLRSSLQQSHSRGSSRNSNGMLGSGGGVVTAVPEDLSDGSIKVGKIMYDPRLVLGHGSNGTTVFRCVCCSYLVSFHKLGIVIIGPIFSFSMSFCLQFS